MNRTIKFSIIALLAVFALVAIATIAVADPADTNSAPTEDWIFDEGKTTTIKNKVWTLRYNMTVVNGSVLVLDGCTFAVNGSSAWDPVYIMGEPMSEIKLLSSKFLADEGSSGFYIETHDNITLTDCEFEGMVENPNGDAAITVKGNEWVTAKIDFVEVRETRMADAFFFENVSADMSNCDIHEIGGTGVFFSGLDTVFNTSYNLSIIDTNIWNCTEDGLGLHGVNHDGIFHLTVYNTDIWNISEDGIWLLLGNSGGDNGNGSLYATFDQMHVYNIGDMSVYLSTLYTQTGTGNMTNIFNVSFTNMTIYNVKNTGMYVQLVYSTVYYTMVLDNVHFTNISMNPTFQRLGAIWWWFQSSQGDTWMRVSNSTFTQINPSAFEVWDYGGNEFEFINCDFSDLTQSAAYLNVKNSASMSPTTFENCTFHDSDSKGIDIYLENYASGNAVHISNCSFYNLSYAALSGDSTYYASGYGFNLTNCMIQDIDNYAADLYGYYMEGTMTLYMENTTVLRTSGLRVELGQDSYNSGANMAVTFLNSTITKTRGTAIGVFGATYYNPCRVYLNVRNSVIDTADGDGIAIKTDITGTSSYYHPRWDASVHIVNVTITDVGSIGVSLQAGGTGTGTRDFEMNYTTIHNAQRGMFNVGFSGRLWYCDIQGTLKEDIIVIDARLDLFYNKFQNINDRKFKALNSGEIHFYYDMDIYVKWDTGAPAVGATVQAFDNKGTLILVLTVPGNGKLPTLTMEPFFVRETGVFSDTPYVITATFLEVTRTVGIKLDSSKVVNVILEDHFDPEIFILYPKEGHLQQSTTLQVRGSAWDSQSGIDEVLVTLDGVNWEHATGSLRWNHTFEVNDTLIGKFSGLFLLRAKAIDNALNEKVTFVMIRIDPTPPELNVDFPYDGYTTNNPELWVRGVTELGSTVEINSIPVEVTVSMFTHMVELVEGPNTISIISIDPLGNIQIERLTVYLDTQEPYIILTSPEEDRAMTNQTTMTIKATVEEDLYVTVNGYHVPYGSENYPEGVGELTYDVTLEPGENVVVVQARDKADNLKIIDFVAVYDTTPPWIQVISPTNGEPLPKPEAVIIGTIDPTATLKVQGESVTVTNGFFEIVILAFEGDNDILLEAEDAAGNSYSETLSFTVDTIDPRLEITMPEEREVTTNEVRYTITGTTGYEDAGGSWVVSADRVRVNGLPYTEVYDEDAGEVLPVMIQVDEQGNFQIPVDLLEGRNEFTIEALDEVENKASTTVTVRLDTVAPTLVMYIDPVYYNKDDQLVSHALTVNITGYTDPSSRLSINDIPLPVSEDGEFNTAYDLSPSETMIVLKSIDSANNERIVTQTIEYKKPGGTDVGEGPDWGFIILLVAIVLLVVVVIGMFVYVRGRREDIIEMEAAEATPLAPMEETVLEEPDTLSGPEDIEVGDEPAPTSAPARPRPRPPQARRVAAPVPVAKEGMPEMEDKDLSEKDAEADIGADETDQEGI